MLARSLFCGGDVSHRRLPPPQNNATRLTSEIFNLPRMDYYFPATDDQARAPRKAGARQRVPREPLAGRRGFSWETQGRSERATRERRAGVPALLPVVNTCVGVNGGQQGGCARGARQPKNNVEGAKPPTTYAPKPRPPWRGASVASRPEGGGGGGPPDRLRVGRGTRPQDRAQALRARQGATHCRKTFVRAVARKDLTDRRISSAGTRDTDRTCIIVTCGA